MKNLNESYLKALSATRSQKVGKRLSREALRAYGVRLPVGSIPTADVETQKLRDFFPKGATVFLVLRKRSSSGMQREIGVIAMGRDLVLHPNYAVAEFLGLKTNKSGDGIVVRGAGMDMGLHIVSHLAKKLYGDERALKHRWL